MSSCILRLPKVKSLTGLSRSTIYLRICQGTFPQPVSLGDRAVGWREEEIDQWLLALEKKVLQPRSQVVAASACVPSKGPQCR
jgi:prophage regulatory protein